MLSGLAAERAEWLRRPAGIVPQSTGSTLPRPSGASSLESADDAWLTPEETRALLSSYGLPLVEERLAETSSAAVEAARELGFPVVVKSAVAGAHKTETGGVALDLGDEEAVRDAAERIGAPGHRPADGRGRRRAARRHRPGPDVRPAGRVRPGRSPRGADRRGRFPDRAAHGRRRGGAPAARRRPASSSRATAEPRRQTRPR